MTNAAAAPTLLGDAAVELELVDAELVHDRAGDVPPAGPPLEERNFFAEAQRIAQRAATPATRRQYAAIYRSFGGWLTSQLGRPPLVRDLDADVLAAYGRHLAVAGGRDGGPAAPATIRVYMSLARACARALGQGDAVDGVGIPRHQPGPPETLTDVDYANLLRVPDRRSLLGKRDHALLKVLGDCGLRSAELRGLLARDLRRPRSNGVHYRLYVHGKGGREREVPVPKETQAALDAWLKVHPLARGVGLLDEQPIFVRVGRHAHEAPLPLSPVAVHRLVKRTAITAGIPARLAHPHALRAYWATRCLELGVPVHEVSERLGHADLRTTARYAAARPERTDATADVLDRAHQRSRRAGGSAS